MNEIELWYKFTQDKKELRNAKYSSFIFGSDNPDELLELTFKQIKTATASLYVLYKIEEEKVPNVGDYSIILDVKKNAKCIIKTTSIFITPFNRVSKEHAFKEGEGDRSLEYWKKVHQEVFSKELKEINLEFSEDMLVVCEEYELVYKI